jgi:dipeptidyl aminopeptidase/acylaminoacyl peptidase
LKTGKSTQLTFTNKNVLKDTRMGKVEKRIIKATDGKDILTWVIYPPDFDTSKNIPHFYTVRVGHKVPYHSFSATDGIFNLWQPMDIL